MFECEPCNFFNVYIINETINNLPMYVLFLISEHFLKFSQFDQYECGKCHKLFISFQALMRHGKCSGSKKKKENRFMCNHCPYTSNISTNFKNHMLTHSSERPFTCPVCGMGFIQKQNMKNHLVQHEKSNIIISDVKSNA